MWISNLIRKCKENINGIANEATTILDYSNIACTEIDSRIDHLKICSKWKTVVDVSDCTAQNYCMKFMRIKCCSWQLTIKLCQMSINGINYRKLKCKQQTCPYPFCIISSFVQRNNINQICMRWWWFRLNICKLNGFVPKIHSDVNRTHSIRLNCNLSTHKTKTVYGEILLWKEHYFSNDYIKSVILPFRMNLIRNIDRQIGFHTPELVLTECSDYVFIGNLSDSMERVLPFFI